MDAVCFEDQLCEEIRRHPHLYDSSLEQHRDSRVVLNSWREIAQTLGKDENSCRLKWKYLRDRYVRAKRKLRERSSSAAGSVCPYIPSSVSMLDWLSDFINHRAKESPQTLNCIMNESACTSARSEQDSSCPGNAQSPQLPLSSLHLLVPPLRLMSACMWQVAQERNVDQYDKLVEFIMLVTEMVPELLNYKQKTQLILGLRARVILESLKRMDEVDCETIQDHLDSFQKITNYIHEEDPDGEVETSKSAFMELVQTLLTDQSEKEAFFKEVFPVQYGARFDTALQILVWEFFYRLEEFLPVPSFSQVFSMFDVSSLDYEFEQFVSDPEDLRRILQQQQEQKKMTKSEFTFMSDTILCTLASKQMSVASEDHVDQDLDGGDDRQDSGKSQARNQEKSESAEDICEDDEETDDSSIETNPNSPLHEYGLSPLSSSPCSEAGDDETAGEASFLSSICSMEIVKEHLDLGGNKESSEERTIQSFNEDSNSTNKNICQKCGKTFASRYTLKNHESVHTSARPFKCTQCDKAYKTRKDLRHHFRIHSNSEGPSYACSLCKKKFSSRSSLKVHLRRHSGERPFACSYCDKKFLTNGDLKAHVRIHTGERPYACTFCNKKFTQPYMLTVHLRIHKKDNPYLCSTCGMSFPSSGALLVHTRKHTGERPHKCDFCGKRYATAIRLTVHRRFHTGERPYSCSKCDKSFHCGSGLKRHMRTHTGEKPYQCVTCHKRFSEKSNMKIHLKVHKNL
ncbi:zinc finger and SCAN domain-containing protein 12-like [Centropristis striata]|uniref:zinc finger and SCAN domain-containing protein 12-like n=1 Tax=Centropristis striata TaxID=184440 RepID=UPI0027DF7A9D|nr:zinc finger and SCAN domain-containing protein 12-like [Centropristis striata]